MNVVSFGWRTAVIGAAVWTITLGAMLVSSHDTIGIIDRSMELTDAGGYLMYAAAAADGEQLSSARCDSLLAVDGVRSSGATVSSRIVVSPLDDEGWRLHTATPGYPALVWPGATTSQDSSLYVGAALANHYGLVDGSWWKVSDGGIDRVFLARVMPPSVRFPEMDLAAIETVPASPAGAVCVLEAESGRQQGVADIAASWFSPTAVTIAPHPIAVGARSPQEEFSQRITLWLPYVGGLCVIALLCGWWTLRERDFALYSVQGLGGSSLRTMLIVEALLLGVLPVTAAVTASAILLKSGLQSPLALMIFAHDSVVLSVAPLLSPAIGLVVLRSSSALQRLRS